MPILKTIIDDIEAITIIGIKEQPFDISLLSPLFLDYLKVSGDLAYTNPEFIKHAQNVLGRAIISYSYFHSPVYRDKIKPEWIESEDCLEKTAKAFFVGKKDLLDKKNWYTGKPDAFDNRTSGSTGEPFGYRIWKDAYPIVEVDRHYAMILKEFGIKDPRVLYMETLLPANYREVSYGMATIRIAEKDDIVTEAAKTICSHGGFGEYAHIVFDHTSYLNVMDYCRFIIDYIQKNKINILMASGGFFELLTTFLISDDSAIFPKLVDLVSNTGDRVNVETLNFLKETGVAKNWCDHMRCWDGGASFFTCVHGTKHSQDELAYLFSDNEGRLGSVDFLSFPSPFVNYLNGDYCSIADDYKKCDCGRWYREFEFHNRKAKQYANNSGGYYTTEDVVNSLLGKYKLGFFAIQDGSISIEDSGLTDDDKKGIILEMAKIYVMAHFFRNPMLSRNPENLLFAQGNYTSYCSECFFLDMLCSYGKSGFIGCVDGGGGGP